MRLGHSPLYCKLCGLEKPLIEAHIVPRCILKPLFSPAGPLRFLSKDLSKFPKRTPTGVYDTRILCGPCDSSLSQYEEYTAHLLQILAPQSRSQKCDGIFFIKDAEYNPLKLGLVSILWRMSITERSEYEQVDIGHSYEKKIQKMLWRKDAGSADQLSVALLNLTDYIGSRSSLGTGSNNFSRSVMWNLGLPGFIAVIKVGPDTDTHVFQPMIIRPGLPIAIGCKSNKMEPEWRDVIEKIQSRSKQTQKPESN